MISTFRERTDITRSLAREMLEAAGWNFGMAMRIYRKGPAHLQKRFRQQKEDPKCDLSSRQPGEQSSDDELDETDLGMYQGSI